jgi:hypothetical protein
MMEESERSGTKRTKTLSCLQVSNSALKRAARRRKSAGEFLAAVIELSSKIERSRHLTPLSLEGYLEGRWSRAGEPLVPEPGSSYFLSLCLSLSLSLSLCLSLAISLSLSRKLYVSRCLSASFIFISILSLPP